MTMALGFALFAGVASEVVRAAAREAETLGYTSFWVNHPGSTDGLAALGVAAKETRRIALGIGVIPLHTRGPENIAGGVRSHAVPLDRLLLGVGSPKPGGVRRRPRSTTPTFPGNGQAADHGRCSRRCAWALTSTPGSRGRRRRT